MDLGGFECGFHKSWWITDPRKSCDSGVLLILGWQGKKFGFAGTSCHPIFTVIDFTFLSICLSTVTVKCFFDRAVGWEYSRHSDYT